MNDTEQTHSLSQWWVEYVDDYNTRRLTFVQNKNDLKYLQNVYHATIVETLENKIDFL